MAKGEHSWESGLKRPASVVEWLFRRGVAKGILNEYIPPLSVRVREVEFC